MTTAPAAASTATQTFSFPVDPQVAADFNKFKEIPPSQWSLSDLKKYASKCPELLQRYLSSVTRADDNTLRTPCANFLISFKVVNGPVNDGSHVKILEYLLREQVPFVTAALRREKGIHKHLPCPFIYLLVTLGNGELFEYLPDAEIQKLSKQVFWEKKTIIDLKDNYDDSPAFRLFLQRYANINAANREPKTPSENTVLSTAKPPSTTSLLGRAKKTAPHSQGAVERTEKKEKHVKEIDHDYKPSKRKYKRITSSAKEDASPADAKGDTTAHKIRPPSPINDTSAKFKEVSTTQIIARAESSPKNSARVDITPEEKEALEKKFNDILHHYFKVFTYLKSVYRELPLNGCSSFVENKILSLELWQRAFYPFEGYKCSLLLLLLFLEKSLAEKIKLFELVLAKDTPQEESNNLETRTAFLLLSKSEHCNNNIILYQITNAARGGYCKADFDFLLYLFENHPLFYLKLWNNLERSFRHTNLKDRQQSIIYFFSLQKLAIIAQNRLADSGVKALILEVIPKDVKEKYKNNDFYISFLAMQEKFSDYQVKEKDKEPRVWRLIAPKEKAEKNVAQPSCSSDETPIPAAMDIEAEKTEKQGDESCALACPPNPNNAPTHPIETGRYSMRDRSGKPSGMPYFAPPPEPTKRKIPSEKEKGEDKRQKTDSEKIAPTTPPPAMEQNTSITDSTKELASAAPIKSSALEIQPENGSVTGQTEQIVKETPPPPSEQTQDSIPIPALQQVSSGPMQDRALSQNLTLQEAMQLLTPSAALVTTPKPWEISQSNSNISTAKAATTLSVVAQKQAHPSGAPAPSRSLQQAYEENRRSAAALTAANLQVQQPMAKITQPLKAIQGLTPRIAIATPVTHLQKTQSNMQSDPQNKTGGQEAVNIARLGTEQQHQQKQVNTTASQSLMGTKNILPTRQSGTQPYQPYAAIPTQQHLRQNPANHLLPSSAASGTQGTPVRTEAVNMQQTLSTPWLTPHYSGHPTDPARQTLSTTQQIASTSTPQLYLTPSTTNQTSPIGNLDADDISLGGEQNGLLNSGEYDDQYWQQFFPGEGRNPNPYIGDEWS